MSGIKNFKISKSNIIILGVCLLAFFVFLIICKFGVLIFVKKIIGVVLIIIGLIVTIKFPQPGDYQPKGFSRLFIIMGIFILLMGVYLLFF